MARLGRRAMARGKIAGTEVVHSKARARGKGPVTHLTAADQWPACVGDRRWDLLVPAPFPNVSFSDRWNCLRRNLASSDWTRRLPCKYTIANTANNTVHIGLTPASQVPAATRTIGGMALVLVAAGAFLSFKDYGDR